MILLRLIGVIGLYLIYLGKINFGNLENLNKIMVQTFCYFCR